ncbi:hypothetical protein [Enterobacter phage ST22]|nr:hypothetical protein [Enterobacter phage ST22]
MAIKYDERLIKVAFVEDGMTMLIDGELVLVEDVHPTPSQGLVDIKLKGQWAFYDAVGTVTIAENIREEADEQPEEPAGE